MLPRPVSDVQAAAARAAAMEPAPTPDASARIAGRQAAGWLQIARGFFFI
jgi:hypothetical protein